MTDDVVAELDRWLRVYNFAGLIDVAVIQRARDEIVALRETIERQKLVLSKGHAQTRDEALDEAVQACTDQTSDDPPPGTYNDACEDCAAAIRALKEKL